MFLFAGSERSSDQTLSLLQATLESTADGILVVDRAGKVTAFNQKVAELWRIPDELLAKRDDARLLDFVRDQLADAEAFLAKVRQLYETPEATSFDLVVLRDGRTFERYSQPQSVGHNVMGRVWSFRDATARLRAERDRRRAEGRLRVILEHVDVGIAEVDRDGRFLFVNRTLCLLLGYRDDELLERTFLDVTHPDDRARNMDVQRSALSSGGMSYALVKRYLHRDGHSVWVDVSVNAVRGESGTVERFVAIIRDITEAKRVAEALRSAEERSRRYEVEAAGREARRKLFDEQAARTAAEEAVRVRDDFVATAGHELKTPLTSLLMHISGMQRALRTGQPMDFPDRVDKLARSGQRLSKLIDELLDVSRITGGRLRLEPEPVELTGLAREVVARFADDSARCGSTISVHADQPVRGSWDRLRIDQVITNLLSNAIKYGRGTPVEIEVAGEGPSATVRVTDHGIGIDDEHREKLFSRFERAVSAREYGGFGLGLWIARQIVEASGGTIDVESAPNRGSTFTFRLPLGANEGSHAIP